MYLVAYSTCEQGYLGVRIVVGLPERLRQVAVRVEPDGVLPPRHGDPDSPHAAARVQGDDEVAVLSAAHCCRLMLGLYPAFITFA